MTLLGSAATVAVTMFAIIAVFQLGLAVGAPWGKAAYGGSHPGVLPKQLRYTSVVGFLLWVVVALFVLRRAGVEVWTPLSAAWLPTTLWIVAGLVGVSVILNAISPSRIERIWAPVGAVAVAAVVTVNLTAA